MTPGTHPPAPLAVFDFGKTNAKLFVFDPDLHVLAEERIAPVWRDAQLGGAPCRTLDTEALSRWMNDALARARVQVPALGGVMISTHGCAAALVGADGALAHPVLDYESEPPAAVRAAYDAHAPSFDETLSPNLPGGLNLARQLDWIERAAPDAMARTELILTLPQFWSWKLGGRAVSEVTSLGCHSQLWAPARGDYSSLVDARGWRRRFPALERAGAVLGTTPDGLRVHNGVHDSNASLHFYRALGLTDCTVVSTGTWVIVFNPGCPADALDAGRDMLANVRVDGQPVPTARFMGGREFDLISERARVEVDREAVQAAVRRGQYALPSFAPGGPFPGHRGRCAGPPPADERERAALGALYLACMTDAVLGLMRSRNTVVVDGGLVHNAAYLGLLAQLRAGQPVLGNAQAEGSAEGAAVIAYEALGHRPTLEPCVPVAPWAVEGLAEYAARWRALAEG